MFCVAARSGPAYGTVALLVTPRSPEPPLHACRAVQLPELPAVSCDKTSLAGTRLPYKAHARDSAACTPAGEGPCQYSQGLLSCTVRRVISTARFCYICSPFSVTCMVGVPLRRREGWQCHRVWCLVLFAYLPGRLDQITDTAARHP